MKVVVYGTLKKGYGNNRLLCNAKYIQEYVIPGYKLYDCGFPVASPQEDSAVLGELWEISPDDNQTIQWLDRLEAEGRMYNRIEVEENTFMYVGNPPYWNNFKGLTECPSNNNHYYWER